MNCKFSRKPIKLPSLSWLINPTCSCYNTNVNKSYSVLNRDGSQSTARRWGSKPLQSHTSVFVIDP